MINLSILFLNIFNPFYTIYAAVRLGPIIPYIRIGACLHAYPREPPSTSWFCHFEKKKKKLPMGLCEASSLLPAAWDAILAVISRSMECFPNVDSWSNIE